MAVLFSFFIILTYLQGMETLDRKQGVGFDGPDIERKLQRSSIYKVCECWAPMRARRPVGSAKHVEYSHHA